MLDCVSQTALTYPPNPPSYEEGGNQVSPSRGGARGGVTMHQENTVFTSPTVRYALLIAIALWSTAGAQEDLILRTGATSQVWTYSREMSGIALTELWANGAEREQCLGIFPGRPGQLGRTETGTIVFQSIPLLLPAPGDILHRGHTISLAPSRYWELKSPGRDILMIDDPDMESIIWTTEKAIKGLKPTTPAIGKNALPNLTSGFNAVRLAQLSLSRWEFKQAAAYYKQAARHFETLARQSAKNGLSDPPCGTTCTHFKAPHKKFGKMDPAGFAATTSPQSPGY